MEETKNSSLRDVKDYIPFIYIVLVCLGYFDKSIFYEKFDIDILHYLSIQELILIFIPVGSILITVLFFFLILLAPSLLFLNEENKASKEDEKSVKNESNLDGKTPSKIMQVLNNMYSWGSNVTTVYLLTIPMLLVFYFAVANFLDVIPLNMRLIIILFIIWGLIFTYKFSLQKKEIQENPRKTLFALLIVMIVAFTIYSYFNVEKAKNIINGNPFYSVKFRVDNTVIQTDSKTLYFGETNDYLFLRNIESGKNHIYSKKDISELVTKKYTKE